MKKKTNKFLAILMAVIMIAVTVLTSSITVFANNNEDDYGNDRYTAHSYYLGPVTTSSISGKLEYAGDVDVFWITPYYDGGVVIYSSNTTVPVQGIQKHYSNSHSPVYSSQIGYTDFNLDANGLYKGVPFLLEVSSPTNEVGEYTINFVRPPNEETNLTLNKSSTTIPAGEAETLTATINPSNASVKTVFWSSSDISVATVSSNGVVTGVNTGTATITAKNVYGKYASCQVTVSNKAVEDDYGNDRYTARSYYLGPVTTSSISGKLEYAGDVDVFWITPYYDGGVVIYSSNTTVPVQGIQKHYSNSHSPVYSSQIGYTDFNLDANGLYKGVPFLLEVSSPTNEVGEYTINFVRPPDEETNLTLNKSSTTIPAGEAETLTAAINPSNASVKTVFWSSSDISVATVSSNGVVTGVNTGTATITAKNAYGKYASCEVTVDEAVNPYGIYEIQGLSSGKLIHAASWNMGATAHLWESAATNLQKMHFERQNDGAYRITALSGNGGALTNPGGSNNGAQLQFSAWTGGDHQKWYVEDVGGGFVKLINKQSGKAIDIDNNSNANGTRIQQWEDIGVDAQKFKLIPASLPYTSMNLANGTYEIQGLPSGKLIHSKEWSIGSAAHIWESVANNNLQRMNFQRQNDGTYKITVLATGGALTNPNSFVNGTGLQFSTWTGGDHQKWYVVDCGNGLVKLINKYSGLAIDISENGTANGTKVQQWKDENVIAQRFRLIPA